jgi:DNA primase
MITVKEKIRLIEACFGNAKLTNDNKNAVVFCPVCKSKGNDKRKLAIEIADGVYHCWVCESKGRNIGRLALKFSIQKKAATTLYSYYKKGNDNNEELRIEEKKTIALPQDFRLIATSRGIAAKSGKAYLMSRGFSEKDIARYRVGISNRYGFKNRVIFPSFDANQKLNFFTARTYEKNIKKRYYNCKTSRKDIIFNEIDIDFKKELILVEGVFDLLHCPENSTCVLGSWFDKNYKLFQLIVKHRTPVTLCFDEDARKKTQKIAKSLHEYCINVKISQHKNKDFGEMTQKEVEHWIKTAKPFNNDDRISYLIQNIKSGSMF